jgi:hypothetical protein
VLFVSGRESVLVPRWVCCPNAFAKLQRVPAWLCIDRKGKLLVGGGGGVGGEGGDGHDVILLLLLCVFDISLSRMNVKSIKSYI